MSTWAFSSKVVDTPNESNWHDVFCFWRLVSSCGHSRLSASCIQISLFCNFEHVIFACVYQSFWSNYKVVDTLVKMAIRYKSRLVCVMFVPVLRVYLRQIHGFTSTLKMDFFKNPHLQIAQVVGDRNLYPSTNNH